MPGFHLVFPGSLEGMAYYSCSQLLLFGCLY